MQKVRIALIQMTVTENVRDNLAHGRELCRKAAKKGVDFILLPEIFCCPYETESFRKHKEPKGGQIWQALSEMAKENKVYLIGGSMPEEEGERIYNTCFVFDPEGKQIGRHRKIHLFDIDVKGGQKFKESDTFSPGEEITLIDTPFGKIGVEICFDIRFQELTRLMALEGARLIFVPAAFNMTTGPAHWELHFRGRALDNQLFMVGCSPARDPKGAYVAYGHSIITSPWGTVIDQLEEKEGILYREIDLEEAETVRRQIPILAARRTDLYQISKTTAHGLGRDRCFGE